MRSDPDAYVKQKNTKKGAIIILLGIKISRYLHMPYVPEIGFRNCGFASSFFFTSSIFSYIDLSDQYLHYRN